MADNLPKTTLTRLFSSNSYNILFQKTPFGKMLIKIFASDDDAGRNKDIRYYFKGDEPQEFELHPNTGVLKLRTSLDYERQTSYTLEVIAMVIIHFTTRI